MIRKLLSQSGFSIIQGMLLAAAVAGMAYVGTKLTTDQKMAQKGIESKGRVEQLHSMIYSVLQNKDHCTESLLVNAVTLPAPSTNYAILGVWTKGSSPSTPVFGIKTFYHATRDLVYMNQSVTINSLMVDIPADLGTHANLKIEYGKLEDQKSRVQSGKGYGAKQVAKNIKIKFQTNPATGTIESCYAVDEAENQDMIKDFCEGLGADNDTSTPNLFEWSDSFQRCVLKDINCPSGQVFAGYDSNGIRKCYAIKDWMNVGDLIDQTSLTSCNAVTSNTVGFVVVGTQVKVQCATTCSTRCDCPTGKFCIAGLCSGVPADGASCTGTPVCIRHWTNGFKGCSSGVWVSYGGISPLCQEPSFPASCP